MPRHSFPHNYAQAHDFVARGRDKRRRPLANNTDVVKVDEGYAIRLHRTNVVTFEQSGKIVLRSGGWYTPTTRDRIQNALSWDTLRLVTRQGHWFLLDQSTDAIVSFREGIAWSEHDGFGGAPEADFMVETSLNAAGRYQEGEYVPWRVARRQAAEAARAFTRVRVIDPNNGLVWWRHSAATCRGRHPEAWDLPCPYCDQGTHLDQIGAAD